MYGLLSDWVWRFNPKSTKKTKHAFLPQTGPMAFCGQRILFSPGTKWSEDKEGLEKRIPCTRCAKLVAPSDPPDHDQRQAAPRGQRSGTNG